MSFYARSSNGALKVSHQRRWFGVAIVAGLAMAGTTPAFAQSDGGATASSMAVAPPTDDLSTPPPSSGSLDTSAPVYGSNPPAPADDSSAVDTSRADSSDASATDGSSDSDNTAAVNSGWDRTGDTAVADSGPSQGEVLELPQVVERQQPSGNQDASAGGGQGSDQTASANGSAAPLSDQLGNLGDYQDQLDPSVVAVYIVPVPTGPVVMPQYGLRGWPFPPNPAIRPGFSPILPPGPALMRPGINTMNGAIMSTSPMAMPPAGAAALPGGWWTRSR